MPWHILARGRSLLFEWDGANIEHIGRHDVEAEEAEEALLDPYRVSRTAYAAGSERREAIVAATEAGRKLFVVFTIRGQAIRVISAREATDVEKRAYRRQGK
jgi:uncharacterized protein